MQYSQPVAGATLASIALQRRSLGQALDAGRRGRCLTTLIAALAADAEPTAQHARQCIQQFGRLWAQADRQLRLVITRAWPTIWAAVSRTAPRQLLSACRGPISTLMVLLKQLGWTASKPTDWQDPRGNSWRWQDEVTLTAFDLEPLVQELVGDINLHYWRQAAQQHLGEDLANGVAAMAAVKTELRRYQAKRAYRERGALLAFVCGAAWPAKRRYEAKLSPTALCPRCQEDEEDEWHLLWGCRCNRAVQGLERDSRLVVEAFRDRALYPSIWLRGLVPDSLAPERFEGEETHFTDDMPTDGFQPVLGEALLFGDCSGGRHTKHALLRRCAGSVVQVHPDGFHQLAAMDFTIPGEQEVGRGELYALVVAMEKTWCDITYVTDRLSVWQLWHRRPWFDALAFHSKDPIDLVRRIGANLAERLRRVTVIWTESHADDKEIQQAFSTPLLAAGNGLADARASAKAEEVEIDAGIADKYLEYLTLAERVRPRAVLCVLASRDATPEHQKVDIAKLGVSITPRQQVVHDSAHVLSYTASGAWQCSRCNCVVPLAGRTAWLQANPCKIYAVSPLAGGAALRLAMDLGDIPILGAHLAHPSHAIAWFQAACAWGCYACGAWSTTRCQKLGQSCTRRRTLHGQRAVKALLAGQLPSYHPPGSLPTTRQARARPSTPRRPQQLDSEPLTEAQRRLQAVRERVRARSRSTGGDGAALASSHF